METAGRFLKNRGEVKGYEVDEFIQLMDELGIEKAVMPAWQWRSYLDGSMVWDETPETIRFVLEAHPTRFFGLMGINPMKRMDGVKALERAIKEYGFRGAHLHTYGFNLPLNHRDYFPYFAKLAELDGVIVMQVGADHAPHPSYLGWPTLIDDIALYFPTLRIVASHIGWPWIDESMNVATRFPNVYIGTAANLPKYWRPDFVHFINTWGKGKVMWGTSYATVDHRTTLEQIDQLGLRDDAKFELLYGTAARVFKI